MVVAMVVAMGGCYGWLLWVVAMVVAMGSCYVWWAKLMSKSLYSKHGIADLDDPSVVSSVSPEASQILTALSTEP